MDEYLREIQKQLNIVEINEDSPNEISTKKLELRNNAIKAMNNILDEIKHKTEIIESYVNKAVKINRKNNEKVITKFSTFENNIIHINIDGLKLTARKIDYLENAGPDLCFIPHLNRFCIRVAGLTLLGNIGEIYGAFSEPKRVRECRYYNKNKNTKCFDNNYKCNYYHNPLYTSFSTEPRNFLANFGYYMPGSDSNYLRYGNRSTLSHDMNNLTAEECARFEDFTVHMLLCLILLRTRPPK
jgi:hypothetical protein